MRTNIDIDQKMLDEAMALTGLATKRATVEEALSRLIRTHRRQIALKELAGIGWDGDLSAMRDGRADSADFDRRR